MIRDPQTCERLEQVILVHGVRRVGDPAYYRYTTAERVRHEYPGAMVAEQLRSHPTVTREAFRYCGRATDGIRSGRLARDPDLAPLGSDAERVMLGGSRAMVEEFRGLLGARGFRASRHVGDPGHCVFEHAFVEP